MGASKVQARNVPESEFNTVCEQLLFVLNQIAARSRDVRLIGR
jgi:hypothetical protein